MKRIILAVAVVVVAAVALAHWYYMDRGRFTTEPQFTDLGRSVSGSELHSDYDPAVTLAFDPAFAYVGGQKFVLYGVADTEQHFFVQTDDADRLTAVYWIQYEAYLPGKRYTYDYSDSPLRVSLGDYEFYTDTDKVSFDPDRNRRRGTDGAMARQLLASKGYTLPREFAYARLVYLTDESRQKELMIIFIDDLARYGVTAAELQPEGARASDWPRIEQAHLARIRATLDVRTPGATAKPWSAQQVLARHVDATGGAAAIENLHSVRYEVEIVEPTFTVTGDYRASRDGRMRIDIYADGERVFSEGIDGDGAWQQGGSGNVVKPVSAAGRQALARGVDNNLWGLYDLASRGHTAQFRGREEIDGTTYFVLTVTMADGFERHVYINPETWMVERERNTSALHPDIDPEERPTETVYTDHFEVCGTQRFRSSYKTDLISGERIQQTTVRSSQCNVAEEALQLERPAGPL